MREYVQQSESTSRLCNKENLTMNTKQPLTHTLSKSIAHSALGMLLNQVIITHHHLLY